MNFFVFTGVDSDPSLTWLLAHDAFTEFSKVNLLEPPKLYQENGQNQQWTPPPSDCIKINCDAFFINFSSSAAGAAVFRDSHAAGFSSVSFSHISRLCNRQADWVASQIICSLRNRIFIWHLKLQATLIPEIGFTKISETFPGWHLQHPASRRSFPELTPPAPGFKEIVSRIGTSNTGLQGDRYTR
ncbi:hypothetical protein V6N11_068716 [Hibiscus sabdariffa]|uniref:RNase H type-1 domain-containing protein n=1 Tax=Hibiscus sabdariffa TaxID=183260 RepID=A0ABR2PAJ4_9ROSI